METIKSSKFVLVLLLLMGAFGVMGGGLVAPGLPTIGAAFDAPEAQIGLILSIYTLAAAISLPFIGYFIDVVGRKKVGLTCLLIDGLTGIAVIYAPSFSVFLMMRFIQGIGIAGLVPVAMTVIGDLFSGERRLQVIGLLSASISMAAVIIPLIGGALASVDWRYVFLVYGFSLLLAIYLYFILPETKPEQGKDKSKLVSKIRAQMPEDANLASQLYGKMLENSDYAHQPQKQQPQRVNRASVIGYISSLSVALKIKKIRNVISHSFVLYFLLYALIAYSPTYLMQTHNFDEVFNGVVISINALFSAFLASRALFVSRYLDWRQRTALGYAIISMSFLLLPFWSQGSFMVSFSFIFFGIGMGIVSPTIYNRVTLLAPPHLTGAVISIFNTMKYIGMTVAPIAIGILLIYTNLNVVFLVVGGVTVCWAILAFLLQARK
ncbi:MFS transporter [Candidatus Thorarchaeota archaeon]|nr:MAG: MFS transporter [Candidatus Thorarchaeota archaeon]